MCLFSFLFLYSCQRQTQESLPTLKITLGNTSDQLNLSEIALSAQCIPLETNDSVIIDKIVRVVSKKNVIYVADRFSIFKYDDGKFQGKLDRHGIGPEEYIHISDFLVDEDGDIWILSRSGQCLYKYEWDGTLRDTIKLDFWASKMSLLDKENMLLYIGNEKNEKNDWQLRQLNLKRKEMVNNYLPIDDRKSAYLHVVSNNYFSPASEKSEIYFSQVFCDTIYKLTPSGFSPIYYVNLDNKNIPHSFFDVGYQNIMDFFQNLSPKGYAYGVNFFMKSENAFWISYYYKGGCYLSVLSDDGTCKNAFELRDNLCLSGYPIKFEDLGIFVQSTDEVIITLLPTDIVEYGNKYLNIEQQTALKNKINYTGEDQNMILLKVKI